MRWLAAAAVVLAGSSTAVGDDELDIAGLDSADLRGDALIWEDGTLYLEPWEGGVSVKLSLLQRSRQDEVGRAIPVRIVGATMRSFVEIELPERTDCAWRRWIPDRRLEALRLFVKREDLAPVLVKPFAASYGDGTRIKLLPGVPVIPTPSGMYAVAPRGDRIVLPIPHGAVGYSYTAVRAAEPELPSGKLVRIDRGTMVRLGGNELAARALWLSSEPAPTGDTTLVRWSARCVDLVVAAPVSALRPIERPRPTPPPAPPGLRSTGHFIPPGVPLATEHGRDVAVAGIAIPVAAPAGETACFEANLTVAKIEDLSYPPTLTRTVKLCAPARLVERD